MRRTTRQGLGGASRRIVLLIAALAVALPNLARGQEAWKRPDDSLTRLLQRISAETPVRAFESGDPALLTRTVRRAAQRALGKMLRDSTALGELFDPASESRNPSSSSSGTRDDRVRFRVGASHLAPKVEMRCATAGGALGVSLWAPGRLAVDLSLASAPGATLHAGYDRSAKRLDLLFRRAY